MLAAAMLVPAQPAFAFALGAPEVRSYIGRPLDVRIPIEGSGTEAADASCFSLTQDPNDFAVLRRPRMDIEQQGTRTFLRIRTPEAVVEPAAILRVRAACAGAGGVYERQFGILLDPMPVSLPLDVVPAMTISIPKTVGEAPPPTREPEPIAPPRSIAPAARVSDVLALRPAEIAPPQSGFTPAGFQLKLSAATLDLAARPVNEAQRAKLREARAILDSDDNTSAVLALQARVDVLQRQLARMQAERLGEPQPAVLPAAAAKPEERSAAGLAAWWPWALLGVLTFVAVLLPSLRSWRNRRMDSALVMDETAAVGIETGRFVAPPRRSRPRDVAEALDETDEAVAQARDLYNAGERMKAAQVLRFAIEAHPERVEPWMPLFDLLLQERLVGEFEELARGFHVLHGSSAEWATVQAAGRQLDPANALYIDDAHAQLAAD